MHPQPIHVILRIRPEGENCPKASFSYSSPIKKVGDVPQPAKQKRNATCKTKAQRYAKWGSHQRSLLARPPPPPGCIVSHRQCLCAIRFKAMIWPTFYCSVGVYCGGSGVALSVFCRCFLHRYRCLLRWQYRCFAMVGLLLSRLARLHLRRHALELSSRDVASRVLLCNALLPSSSETAPTRASQPAPPPPSFTPTTPLPFASPTAEVGR